VKLHRPLGPAEASPVKPAGVEFHRGAVQGKELVFELEFFLGAEGLASGQQIVKELFVEFPRSARISVGERGTLGFLLQSQMLEPV
jgi:hypothetical protein